MKKLLYFISFIIAATLLADCDNDDQKEIFPEEYFKIFYIKNSGTHEVAIAQNDADAADSLLIIKAGAKLETIGNVQLSILSADDVLELYGFDQGSFVIIPEDAYSFIDGTDFSFASDDFYKYAHILFDSSKISDLGKSNAGKRLILPIRLISEEDNTVNQDKDKALIEFNVETE